MVFINDEKRTADGSARQVVRQINLVFDDESSIAVVDRNGAKKMQAFDENACLYDLLRY